MRRLASALVLLAACRLAASEPAEPTRAVPTVQATAAPATPRVSQLFQQALELRKSGDEAATIAKLDEVLAAQPTFALAALERAELLVDAGDAAKALPDAQLAASALVGNPRAFKVRGQVEEETGSADAAIADYQHSLQIRDDANLRRHLASLTARQGRLAEAAIEWEKLRDADPKDLGAHMELSTLYEKLDRPASAEQEFRAVLTLAPANAALHRRFAEFLDREGKAKDARDERAKADALQPPVDHDDRKMRPLQKSAR